LKDAVIVGVFVLTVEEERVREGFADELDVLEPCDEPLIVVLRVFEALTVPVVDTVAVSFREFVIVGEPERVRLGFTDLD
jgi:hypothetical protein